MSQSNPMGSSIRANMSVPPHPSSRSLLHRLSPQGVGTPYCESAYSYVRRLADSHRITSYQLAKFVCEPRPGMSAEELPLPIRLDSQCASSAEFISRLMRLTGVAEVSHVGLAWLHGRTAPNEKLKPNLAWCPGCLREANEHEQPVYGQSAWLFINNRRCALHDLPLIESCPRCGQTKDPRINVQVVPLDICARCGCDLADPSSCALQPEVDPSTTTWDRHAARQIGELIAHAPEIQRSDAKLDTQRICLSALERGRASSLLELARLAGTDATVRRFSKDGASLPSVDVLLRLCLVADVSLAGVMCPDLWAEDFLGMPCSDAEGWRRKRRNRSHDWDGIRRRVEERLLRGEVLSITTLSRELDVRPAMLLFRLGELGRRVTQFKQARDMERQQGEIDALVDRIVELSRKYSYFGRRLAAADVCRSLGLSRDTAIVRRALEQFDASGESAKNLSLFAD